MKLERTFVQLYKAVLHKHKELMEGKKEASITHGVLSLQLTEVEMQLAPDVTKRLVEYVNRRAS